MTKTMTKGDLGKKEFILAQAHNSSSEEIRAGTKDRNLEAEMETEAMKNCYLLSPCCILCILLSYTAQDPLTSSGPSNSELSSPTPIFNKEMLQQTLSVYSPLCWEALY